MVALIDEDDIPQAIFDYATDKYGHKAQELYDKYAEEFPEKDWDLSNDSWSKNFLSWLFYEKVLPETGMTIAEEFAEQSTDLTNEMKKNIRQMREIIRSDFVVLSERNRILKIKDRHDGTIYNLKRAKYNKRLPINSIFTGRIYPFGKYYRSTGILLIKTSPLILDPDVLMGAYENDQITKIENIQLRKDSSFKSVMNKYPAHWVNWMCQHYRIQQRLKKDKIREIERKLTTDIHNIVENISKKGKDVLRLCIENSGVVKYGKLKEYDDDLGFFWENQSCVSTIGTLRQKGILFVGKMRFGDRNYKVAFIPNEIRNPLKNALIPQ